MKNDKVRCERCGKWISVCKMRRHRKKRCGISGGKIQPVDPRRLIQRNPLRKMQKLVVRFDLEEKWK